VSGWVLDWSGGVVEEAATLKHGLHGITMFIHSFIHSLCSLSYDRSVAPSKASSPQSAI
jgi:hypothetical protein